MRSLTLIVFASLNVCTELRAAEPPLPDGAVARLGHARIVVEPYRQLHITPDGKLLTCQGKWFDVESGEAVASPYSTPEKAELVEIREDGRAEYVWYVADARESVTLEPNRPVTLKGAAKANPPPAKFVIEAEQAKGEDVKDWTVRIAAPPKPGREPAWKDLTRTATGYPQWNGSGGKVVWPEDGDGAATVFHVHDFDTGKAVEIPVPSEKNEKYVEARLSPDDTTLVVRQRYRTTVFNTADGKEARVLDVDSDYKNVGEFTADGRGFFVPDRHSGAFVPLDPKAKPIPLEHRGGRLEAFALFPDSKRVAVADDAGVVRIHDLKTGRQTDPHCPYPKWEGVRVVGPHTAACWSQVGELLTWDLRTGAEVAKTTVPGGLRGFDAEFNRDGMHLVASGYGTARVIDTRTGKPTLETAVKAWGGRHESQFSPDGRWVAVESRENEEDGTPWHLDLYAVSTGRRKCRLVAELSSDPFVPAPDGRTLTRRQWRRVEVVETATGTVRWAVECGSDPRLLLADAAGKRLVAVCANQAEVLNAATGRAECVLPAGLEKGTPRRVALSASGRWFAVLDDYTSRENHHLLIVYDLDGESPGKPVYDNPVPIPEATGLALDDDGTRLVTSHPDGTCLVWDLAAWAGPHVRPKAAVKADVRPPWEKLADPDAAVAQKAIESLLGDPDGTVKLFEKNLPPAEPFPEADLTKLIADLGSKEFATREVASKKLTAVADQAEETLRAALKASTVPEQQERLEQVLAKLSNLSGDHERLRQVRAVELLERIGTPEAVGLLKRYTAGAKGALLTREAADSLKRVKP